MVVARYEYTLRLVPHDAQRVLDVGCGDGYLLHRFAKRGKLAYCIDLSMAGLRAAQSKHAEHLHEYAGSSPKLFRASGLELPFEDRQFDCVVATEVIEHVKHPQTVLDEIKRVLSPAGLAVLSTPNKQPGVDPDPNHVREYTYEELADLLFIHFPQVEIYGLGKIQLLKWHGCLLRWERIHLVRVVWRRFLHGLFKLGINPFSYPFASTNTCPYLLFGICRY